MQFDSPNEDDNGGNIIHTLLNEDEFPIRHNSKSYQVANILDDVMSSPKTPLSKLSPQDLFHANFNTPEGLDMLGVEKIGCLRINELTNLLYLLIDESFKNKESNYTDVGIDWGSHYDDERKSEFFRQKIYDLFDCEYMIEVEREAIFDLLEDVLPGKHHVILNEFWDQV